MLNKSIKSEVPDCDLFAPEEAAAVLEITKNQDYLDQFWEGLSLNLKELDKEIEKRKQYNSIQSLKVNFQKSLETFPNLYSTFVFDIGFVEREKLEENSFIKKLKYAATPFLQFSVGYCLCNYFDSLRRLRLTKQVPFLKISDQTIGISCLFPKLSPDYVSGQNPALEFRNLKALEVIDVSGNLRDGDLTAFHKTIRRTVLKNPNICIFADFKWFLRKMYAGSGLEEFRGAELWREGEKFLQAGFHIDQENGRIIFGNGIGFDGEFVSGTKETLAQFLEINQKYERLFGK